MKKKEKIWTRKCLNPNDNSNCKIILKYNNKYHLLNSKGLCKSCAGIGKHNHEGKNNPFYNKTHSKETRKLLGRDVSGKKNPMYGKGELLKGKNNGMFGKISPTRGRKRWDMLVEKYGIKNAKIKQEEHRKKLRLKKIERLERLNGQANPNYNPAACQIIEKYGKKHGYNFQHAENGGEFLVKGLGYWLDGYDNEKNIAIEIYEQHHKKYIDRDKMRKQEIIKHLNCKFIEIWI